MNKRNNMYNDILNNINNSNTEIRILVQVSNWFVLTQFLAITQILI